MSFIGIGVFWVSLPDIPTESKPNLTVYLAQAIRPLGMLLFVEAIAWFLLRQYRALIEDYKVFHRVYLRRANLLAALRITSDSQVSAATLPVVTTLLSDGMYEPSAAVDSDSKNGDSGQGQAAPAFELLRTVVERTAEVAEAAIPKVK